jgi:NAD(P)-dependent dehydrogenase (short-subunit alcohol dehydrogenase family)
VPYEVIACLCSAVSDVSEKGARRMSYLDERANLEGKVAAVVGGAHNVGAAVTMALARAGVDITFCDRRAEAVETTRAEVQKLGRRVTAMVTDAFDEQQLDGFYDALDRDFDRLDILVNVAGETHFRRFTDTTREEWTGDIHRNFGWVIQSISRALPKIRVNGRGGSIINFTTIEAHRGAAGIAAYAGAKAGLTNFSRALGVELAPERIRVNLLAPDTTPSDTSMNAVSEDVRKAIGAASPELLGKSFAMYVPMGVAPPADSLGDAAVFLASDLSAYTTGSTLYVDGGTSASMGFLHWPGPMEWSPAPPATLFREDILD